MDDLIVPFGLTIDGNLVSVESAKKGLEYFCPSCESRGGLRDGEFSVKHFSHLVDSSCSQESIIHKTAKHLVKKAVLENSSGKQAISIDNECACCNSGFITSLEPGTFTHAEEEKDVGGYICDVLAYKDGNPALAIEVCSTTPVDEQKGSSFPLYWLEVKAEDIINDCYNWLPTEGVQNSVSGF